MVCRAVLAVSAILALPSPAQTGNSPLLELSKQFDVAMKARDAAKVASFYAEDAVSLPPNQQPVRGRQAIEADLKKMFQDFPNADLTGADRLRGRGRLGLRSWAVRVRHGRKDWPVQGPLRGGLEAREGRVENPLRHLESQRPSAIGSDAAEPSDATDAATIVGMGG